MREEAIARTSLERARGREVLGITEDVEVHPEVPDTERESDTIDRESLGASNNFLS